MRVLVENTAGGKNSVARYMDSIERLWEVIGDLNVGLCLDTCHTWAGGIPTEEACLLYTSPSPRDAHESRMPSSA